MLLCIPIKQLSRSYCEDGDGDNVSEKHWTWFYKYYYFSYEKQTK